MLLWFVFLRTIVRPYKVSEGGKGHFCISEKGSLKSGWKTTFSKTECGQKGGTKIFCKN